LEEIPVTAVYCEYKYKDLCNHRTSSMGFTEYSKLSTNRGIKTTLFVTRKSLHTLKSPTCFHRKHQNDVAARLKNTKHQTFTGSNLTLNIIRSLFSRLQLQL